MLTDTTTITGEHANHANHGAILPFLPLHRSNLYNRRHKMKNKTTTKTMSSVHVNQHKDISPSWSSMCARCYFLRFSFTSVLLWLALILSLFSAFFLIPLHSLRLYSRLFALDMCFFPFCCGVVCVAHKILFHVYCAYWMLSSVDRRLRYKQEVYVRTRRCDFIIRSRLNET